MPQPATSPLDTLEVLRGPVEAQTEGAWVTLTFGDEKAEKFKIFRVELDRSSLPVSFDIDAGEVYYWGGHLIVLAPAKGQGWHFSVPGSDESAKRRPGVRPSMDAMKALLTRYDLTEVPAAGLASYSGPKALQPERPSALGSTALGFEPENQDPGGTGVGTCGDGCSISCRDGSTCTISCGPNRCATCTCPLSCVCS